MSSKPSASQHTHLILVFLRTDVILSVKHTQKRITAIFAKNSGSAISDALFAEKKDFFCG